MFELKLNHHDPKLEQEIYDRMEKKSMHQLTVDLLAERCATHGNYTNHAEAAQAIKLAMLNTTNRPWLNYSAAQREALDMIAHKIGRILAGDPDFADHWRDISGYATLVADRCTK